MGLTRPLYAPTVGVRRAIEGGSMSLRATIELKYVVYLGLISVVLFSPALAGTASPQNNINIPHEFDAANLFRLTMGALIGILIFISRRAELRLTKAENRIEEFNQINAVRTEKLLVMEGQIRVVVHEQAQLTSIIGMLRETVLTKYEERSDTERHRAAVEEKLARQGETLQAICHRLDFMARPLHRVTDDLDKGNHNG